MSAKLRTGTSPFAPCLVKQSLQMPKLEADLSPAEILKSFKMFYISEDMKSQLHL